MGSDGSERFTGSPLARSRFSLLVQLSSPSEPSFDPSNL